MGLWLIGIISCFIPICSFSQVQVAQDPSDPYIVRLQVTGPDAAIIRKVFVENSPPLKAKSEEDTSNIREITCTHSDCELVLEGEFRSSQDTSENYDPEFNKELMSLQKDQVLVTSPFFGKDGLRANQEIDGIVMRRVVRATQFGVSGASYKFIKNERQKLEGHETTIPFMESTLKLQNIRLDCRTSIGVDWSNRNLIMENCSVVAVGKKQGT